MGHLLQGSENAVVGSPPARLSNREEASPPPPPGGLACPTIDGLSFAAALAVAYRDLIYASRMLDNGEEDLEGGLRQLLESAGRLIAFFQPIEAAS